MDFSSYDDMPINYEKYVLLFYDLVARFIKDYGQIKADKVLLTIVNSKHTKKMISVCSSGNLVPTPTDLRIYVLKNISLMFANKKTEQYAMAILLNEWHNKINIRLELATLEQLIELQNDIKNAFVN